MEGDAEVCGRDEDLDVEGQNDEDDYDDMKDENFVLDYPDMEHPNVRVLVMMNDFLYFFWKTSADWIK
ncbi:hypothetical protein C5167_035006 [Papaver somniferum]|uniref:Uncharacterized protein n=1 Tax=Papaver somniferum TaxID=3469 RepID=A0A4Y7KIR4_PAPSO|nr:hypothetical protein C5167_035006 [Papaver somniferum]